MQTLSINELEQLDGGGFWSGFACGFALVGALGAVATANPFALYVAGGAALTCIRA